MKLYFWGAARQVPGSMFLLETDSGYRMLIDCGTDLSSGNEGSTLPFEASSVDVVLLTHAHLDHSGRIPDLYRQGYKGQVLSTMPTWELTKLLLKDAATIHNKALKRKINKKKYSSRKEDRDLAKVLQNRVEDATEHFVPLSFLKPFEVTPEVKVTFYQAGHLLGAASIVIAVRENGREKTIAFTGDLGRENYPLLPDPVELPQVDYLVCESTYGNRAHNDDEQPEQKLKEIILEACVKKRGRLIIPSFSVGRSQSLLFTLKKLWENDMIPKIRIFADSPMARECTRIYQDYVDYMNVEAREFSQNTEGLFDFDNLTILHSYRESKKISSHSEPCIIVSSSGMLTGGRIQHHVKKNLHNQYATILLVGYCAENTPGHDLSEQANAIEVKGKAVPVKATILKTDVFSGHADRNDLLKFVKVQDKRALKKIFLVHGDRECMEGFKTSLIKEGYENIEMPEKGEVFEI